MLNNNWGGFGVSKGLITNSHITNITRLPYQHGGGKLLTSKTHTLERKKCQNKHIEEKKNVTTATPHRQILTGTDEYWRGKPRQSKHNTGTTTTGGMRMPNINQPIETIVSILYTHARLPSWRTPGGGPCVGP